MVTGMGVVITELPSCDLIFVFLRYVFIKRQCTVELKRFTPVESKF